MKSRITAVLLGALAAALVVAAVASAAATAKKPFTASFAGAAVVRSTSDTTADLSAKGAGKSNLLGASKMTGLGKGFSGTPCNTFSGGGTITGKTGGLKYTLAPGAKACTGATETQFNVTATANVAGGTGAYKKAKGVLKVTGTYDRGTGKFTATFKGVLTV